MKQGVVLPHKTTPLLHIFKVLSKHYLVHKTCLYLFGYITYESIGEFDGGFDGSQADFLKNALGLRTNFSLYRVGSEKLYAAAPEDR